MRMLRLLEGASVEDITKNASQKVILGPKQRALESRMNFLFAQIMYLSNVLKSLKPPGVDASERSF
jgi:hypothetical protein